MLISKRFFILSLLFILLSFQFSCSPSNKKPSPPIKNTTLIIGSYGTPEIINPILTYSSISAILIPLIFDGLIKLDDNLNPQPQLANQIISQNKGKNWTISLKQGIRFHDGVELTAKDIKFTYQLILDSKDNIRKSSFNIIDKINVLDRYRIQFILKTPSAYFPNKLHIGILPKHKFKNNKDIKNNSFNYKPAGTGPYKLITWGKEEILLEANTDYFQGPPKISKIKTKIFKNKNIEWVHMGRGDLDISFSKTKKINFIKNLTHSKLHSILGTYYSMIWFNLKNELFRDKDVRVALNYAINKKLIIYEALEGRATIASTTIYPLSSDFNSKLKPYLYNVTKAKKLLKKAGWNIEEGYHLLSKKGREFKFELAIRNNDTDAERIGLHIQQQLLEIGIEVILIKIPINKFFSTIFENKIFDTTYTDLNAKIHLESSHAFFHSAQIKKGINFSSYNNIKIDKLLIEGIKELDEEKRKQIAFEFQKEFYSDPPGIFLYWRDMSVVVHNRVKGVKLGRGEVFDNIKDWYITERRNKIK